MTTPDRLEFRYHPRKQLALMIVCSLLVAASWFLARTTADPVYRIAGWLGVGFFALCAAIAVRRLIAGGVPIVFDRSGIAFPTGDIGLVPWTDIKSYAVVTVRGNYFLALTFNDPDRTLTRVSAAKRKWAQANKALGWGHWALSFSGLDPGIDEAVAFIREQTSIERASV